jgi:hypothetical protein
MHERKSLDPTVWRTLEMPHGKASWAIIGKEGAHDEAYSRAIYMTPDELDQRVLELTVEAHQYPEGSENRQAILIEIAQMRMYPDAKRWIESPGLKPGR